MSKYTNPTNHEDYIEKIKNCPTLLEVTKVLNEVFPGWIQGGNKRFSKDYQNLENNWEEVCNKAGVEKTAILVVDNYLEDDEHTLVRTFAEIFTSCGFYVRKSAEITSCTKCGSALLSEEMYKIANGEKPDVWSENCSEC